MKTLAKCPSILPIVFIVLCVAVTLITQLGCEKVIRVLEEEKPDQPLRFIEDSDYLNLQPGFYKMNVHYRDLTAYTKDGTIPYLETLLPYKDVSEKCMSVLEYTIKDFPEHSGRKIKLCESEVVRIYLHPQPDVFNNKGEENLPIWFAVGFFPQVIVKITNKIGIRSNTKRTFYEYEGELIEVLTHIDPFY